MEGGNSLWLSGYQRKSCEICVGDLALECFSIELCYLLDPWKISPQTYFLLILESSVSLSLKTFPAKIMKVSFYTWPSKEHGNELIPSFIVVVSLNTVAETTFDLVALYRYFK